MADREQSRPVTGRTRFDIASISKIFLTAAVLKLREQGKVGLDEPFCSYVDGFVMADPRYKDITVRMMLNHSSGLMGSCYNNAFCHEPYEGYMDHMLAAMRYSHLKHDPGAKSSYCNDGFALCEALVENVSGVKYIDFLSEHIFIPLSMNDTGVSVGIAGAIDAAELYDGPTGKKTPLEVPCSLATGGLSSTPEDLCRFGQSFCKNAAVRVLSDESLAIMRNSIPTGFSDKLRTRQEDWHLGWDVNGMDKYANRGIHVFMKGGLTGYASKFIVLPDLDVSFALSFAGGSPSQKTALLILDAFLEEKGFGSFASPVKRKPVPEPISVDILRFAGYYSNGSAAVQFTFPDNETLKIRPLLSEDAPALFYHSGGSFYYKSGAFANTDGSVPHYFAEADGMAFFAAENEHCSDLVYQKLEYINGPKLLNWDIDGKTWLNINIDADQDNWNGMFVVKSALIKELPGYINFAGVKAVKAGDYAAPVGTYFRDQTELLLKEENGILTAYVTDYIMRREDSALPLPQGDTVVQAHSGRTTLWYKTQSDSVLTVKTVPGASAWVISPDGKQLYDSHYQCLGEGVPFFAPKGSFLVLRGAVNGVLVQAS
jgi:CubicO group peptidase (beta-lactamase class C family)